MKKFFKSGGLFVLSFMACTHSQNKDDALFEGNKLFDAVEKYVSFGEHRTAAPADSATVEWLGTELLLMVMR